jgi:hypothetical protein
MSQERQLAEIKEQLRQTQYAIVAVGFGVLVCLAAVNGLLDSPWSCGLVAAALLIGVVFLLSRIVWPVLRGAYRSAVASRHIPSVAPATIGRGLSLRQAERAIGPPARSGRRPHDFANATTQAKGKSHHRGMTP